MHVKLSCRFRDIQIVLKEFLDRCRRLLVEHIRNFIPKYLMNKHLAQRHRELIDQSANTQITVCDRLFFHVEDFSHLKRHLCLLVGFRNILQVVHTVAVADPDAYHRLRVHIVHDH